MGNIDKKFKEIGFIKIIETEYGAEYERKKDFGYIQCLDIMHKHNGMHIIQSYQKDINKDGFNNMVGITMYEAKLCYKKMKQMKFKEKKL